MEKSAASLYAGEQRNPNVPAEDAIHVIATQ
jgi:hypothetical protein